MIKKEASFNTNSKNKIPKKGVLRLNFEMIKEEDWSVKTRLKAEEIIDTQTKKMPLFKKIEIFYDKKLIFSFKKGILFSYFSLYKNFYIDKIVKLMFEKSGC